MGQEKKYTEEQLKRKSTLRRRMFWLLVCFDILLFTYIIIQIALLVR